MKAAITAALGVAMLFGTLPVCGAPASSYEDISFNYLPAQTVSSTVKKMLSPQGRFVILSAAGVVRIYDNGERVQAARRALKELQQRPANVVVEIRLTTGLRRVTRRPASQEPVLDYEIPFPQNYDPPRISKSYSGGTIVVVPAQPRNFTTRRAGPGDVVNLAPTGYRTLDPDVRLSETSLEGGVTHKWTGSAILGKAATIPVLANAPDLAGLRQWALAHGATSEKDLQWTAAGTGLLVTPAISNGDLNLNVIPQIAVYGQDRRQPAKLVSLDACATLVPIQRGAASTLDKLSGTDAEFYRVFFGARESSQETLTSMSLSAAVHYLGLQGTPTSAPRN